MRILVTGKASYAGTEFKHYISKINKEWEVDFISVRNNDWLKKDFSIYEAIYHVAGIVHIKERLENEVLYYEVNRDLTYRLAQKAKNEGVKSFIFLSTMAVYGLIGKIGEETVISKETRPLPSSFYGKSKFEAEELIKPLQTEKFNISILRIPMIYGFKCPGNYRTLSKLARKIPIFPNINNKRSMIFIDQLSKSVVHIIEERLSGLFLIKNPEDVSTLEMVNEISKVHKNYIHNSHYLGVLVKLLGNYFAVTKKLFGNLVYKDEDCMRLDQKQNNFNFTKSIIQAEGKVIR